MPPTNCYCCLCCCCFTARQYVAVYLPRALIRSHHGFLESRDYIFTVTPRLVRLLFRLAEAQACSGWPSACFARARCCTHRETTKSTRMNGGYTRRSAWRACAGLLIAVRARSSPSTNRSRAISVQARGPISRFISHATHTV